MFRQVDAAAMSGKIVEPNRIGLLARAPKIDGCVERHALAAPAFI